MLYNAKSYTCAVVEHAGQWIKLAIPHYVGGQQALNSYCRVGLISTDGDADEMLGKS